MERLDLPILKVDIRKEGTQTVPNFATFSLRKEDRSSLNKNDQVIHLPYVEYFPSATD